MEESWFAYIATARTGRYYVGISSNVAERIQAHNTGKGSRFAIEQEPFMLAYQSPRFESKALARKREIQIKGWSRGKKQQLIYGDLV
jgi:putative endonuclease